MEGAVFQKNFNCKGMIMAVFKLSVKLPMQAIVLVAFSMVLLSCGGKYSDCAETTNEYPNIFPDYVGVTVPVNIAPLNFDIKGAEHVEAVVELDGKQVMEVVGEKAVEFPEKEWKSLLGKAAGKTLDVKVSEWSKKHPGGISYRPFSVSVSKDSIDTWIAYRLVPPGYELWNRMGIYQRNIENFKQETIIKNSQNNGGCVNCHSFCNYSPKNWLFHARGKGGSTVITLDGDTRKLPIEKLGPKKSATYPFWHPSGKFVAFSSNLTRQTFYGISRDKIEVFDMNSDLIIYDVKANSVLTDPRFCGSADWETFPAFSPDGKYLYMCVAHLGLDEQQRQMMQAHFEKMKYALIRVPFDANTGKLGDRVDTVYSPSRHGGSVSLPRISPDGRYVMFTKADCATFPIQHVEADLKMIDLNSMKFVNTDVINSPYSDSYHSWSSNGRWVVFSSRRVDGKYTRLFFSHCDAAGRFTKPFMLPQKNPEQNGELLYAYNIPEFIKSPVRLDREKTAELFRVK